MRTLAATKDALTTSVAELYASIKVGHKNQIETKRQIVAPHDVNAIPVGYNDTRNSSIGIQARGLQPVGFWQITAYNPLPCRIN